MRVPSPAAMIRTVGPLTGAIVEATRIAVACERRRWPDIFGCGAVPCPIPTPALTPPVAGFTKMTG